MNLDNRFDDIPLSPELQKVQIIHLCTFKTPTSSAVMSEQGDADCAFIMRNGVKF